MSRVASSDEAAYTHSNGAFVFVVQATQTKPTMWSGTPDGQGLYRIRCR